MFDEALIIVDMQHFFETARNDWTIRNVIELIKKAKQDNVPIIVLEYVDPDEEYEIGETMPRLKKHLDDYNLTRYVLKYNDDGGNKVIECLEQNGWEDIVSLTVCGVNIQACVAETVDTLIRSYDKEVTIVKKACNGDCQRRVAFSGKACNNVFQQPQVMLV